MLVETIWSAEIARVVSIGSVEMAIVVSGTTVLILAGILGKEGEEGSV